MPSRASLFAPVSHARHRRRRRRVLAAALLAGAGLAAPARAELTLQPLKPCYVSVTRADRELMDIRATAEPLHRVDIQVAGTAATVDADPAGNVFTRPSAPFQRRGQRRFTVSLTEFDRDGNVIDALATETSVTDLDVGFRARRNTRRRVRFHGRGFTQAKPIYGHYVFDGRVRRTVRFAKRPTGACGRFSVRRPEIPILLPHAGRWLLQVDQQRRWSPMPDSVLVPVYITVELRP